MKKLFSSRYIIIAIFLLFSLQGMAHEYHENHFSFIENCGQWDSFIRFKSVIKNGSLFFEQKAITFSFIDKDYMEKVAAYKSGNKNIKLDKSIWIYSYQVQFENAQEARISGSEKQDEYYNYYTSKQQDRWKSNVPLFHELTYQNLYDGIDLRYYTKYNTLKYDFIVAPGASVTNIQMRYLGTDRLFVKNGVLEMRIGKMTVSELAPYAYQIGEDGEPIKIKCEYVLKDNIVSFKVGEYATELPLIIDPTIIFASYSGSTADNWGYTATYDINGNLYGGGTVYNTGYPTTLGAYNTTFMGSICDIGITKFNTDGTARIFSTYLGGTDTEMPHSLIVNENNELYVLGTTSSLDFPTTTGCFQSTMKGGTVYTVTGLNYYSNGSDVFITKFSADGTQLMSSTYFGGSGNDGLNTASNLNINYSDEVRGEIQLDKNGNVYIVSSTYSTDLPITSNVFQPTCSAGVQNGFIAKLSYNLQNLIWCSYFGGESNDAIYCMDIDEHQDIYIVGGTASSHLPIVGGVQSTNAGDIDGFVAKIASNGTQILASTYLGTFTYDQAYLIELDKYGAVYVMGQTNAPTSYWVTGNVWASGNGHFVTKLNNNLSQKIVSTSFGNAIQSYQLSPTAMMVDICGNVHISGWGGNTNGTNITGFPITPDAFKPTTDVGDFYLITIGDNLQHLVFATYFGGVQTAYESAEHVDGGTSRFDKKGTIYQAVCAGCGGKQNFPVTPGVIGPTNNSPNCNLGVVKIEFKLQGIVAEFIMPSMVCAPRTISFENTSSIVNPNTTTYNWDFGDGTTSNDFQPTHIYTESGTYNVQLIISDTSSCNYHDTIEKQLIVLANKLDTLPTLNVCKGQSIQIGIPPASNQNTYTWVPGTGLTDSTISNPYFIDSVSRNYLLLANNGVCTDTLQQKVIVQNLPSGVSTTLINCLDSPFVLLPPIPSGSTYFHWSTSPQFTDTLNNYPTEPNIYVSKFDKDTTFYLHRKNDACEAFDTIKIETIQYEIALDSIPTICLGDSLLATLKIISSRYSSSYTNLWHIDNGSLVVGSSDFQAWLKPTGSTDVHIVTTDQYGCQVKTTEHINISKVEPLLTKTDISCFGANNGQIVVTCKDSSMPYSYTWTPAVATTNTATDLIKGTYKVVVADTHHCATETSITINEPEKIQLNLYDTVTTNSCGNHCIGKGSVQIQGGTPPYTYRWNTGATSTTIDQLCVGSYSFYLADNNACLDTISFNVSDSSKLSIDYLSEMPSCYDKCDGKFILLVENAVYPIKITWNDGRSDSITNTLCKGNYQVEVVDSLLCKRQLNFTLNAPTPISLTNSQVARPSCKGYSDGSIIVFMNGGTPPYTYSWNGTIGTDSLLNIQASQYHLHVTDINNCEYDTTFTITDYDSLLINDITTTNIPCEEVCNGIISMNITGGCPPYRYILNGKETTSLNNLCKGTYQIKVLDRNNCSVQGSTIVKDSSSFSTPIKAWADTNMVYKGRSTMLHVTDLGTGFTYHWTPEKGLKPTSGTDITATLTESTLFTVVVKDKWGCSLTDTVSIGTWEVICDEPFVFVPNAFTPNNDGHNDILYVRGDLLEEIDFKVYDRWGEKIFETQDLNQGWDGTYKGKACEPGVYFYYLQATCSAGVKSLIKGNVTLIR